MIESSQHKLCAMLIPGMEYEEIQNQAHRDVAAILCELEIANVDVNLALEAGLTKPFFPHGIGHGLGLQVHDVGGKQSDGNLAPPNTSDEHIYLRALRKVQVNDVMTIEPGFYFIPSLLNEIKTDKKRQPMINWDLVEELIPYGGIRIEDNVVASKAGPINLTREYLPNWSYPALDSFFLWTASSQLRVFWMKNWIKFSFSDFGK